MAEHGLQCGFCTPGMLITARDIVTRLPDADERRVRLELSGNLCRCTGYVGIVRAIRRVLEERRARALAASAVAPRGLGPVGSRHAGAAGRFLYRRRRGYPQARCSAPSWSPA
jgi:carbon-monoxide dehydrogenase small subunit